jgi:hypothetical protein
MAKLWILGGGAALVGGALIGFMLLPAAQEGQPQQAAAIPAPASKPQALPAPVQSIQTSMPVDPQALPLQPAPQAAPLAQQLSLWQADQLSAGEENGIPVHYAELQPAALEDLSVGQTLELALPGRSQPLQALLSETRNTGDTAVWQGSLLDGNGAETLTVVRGVKQTHIAVATLDGSYSVIVDNKTGKAVITDENEIAQRSDPNDHVDYQPRELPPLAPPAQG